MNYAKKNNYVRLSHDLTVLNNAVCHIGKPGMEWYKNKAARYQNHAKYAMGKPKFEALAKERKQEQAQEEASKRKLSRADFDGDTALVIPNSGGLASKKLHAIKKGIPSLYDYGGGYSNWAEGAGRVTPILSGRDTAYKQTITLGPIALQVGLGTATLGVPAIRPAQIAYRWTRLLAGAVEDVRRARSPRDKETGLHIKDEETSVIVDAERVNPLYGTISARANVNALKCITAMEMRRRGYDVAVKNRVFESYKKGNEHKIEDQFKGAKVEPIPSSSEIKSTLNKQPEGSRGVVFFNWKFTPTSGHCFYYTVEKGKVVITDPQSGRTFPNINALDKLFKSSSSPSYARLDNTEAVMAYIKEAVK